MQQPPPFALSFPAIAQHTPAAPDTSRVRGVIAAATGVSPTRRITYNEPTLVVAMHAVLRRRNWADVWARDPRVDDAIVSLNHNGTNFLTSDRTEDTTGGAGGGQEVDLSALLSDARFLFIFLDTPAPALNFQLRWAYEDLPPHDLAFSIDIFSMSIAEWVSRSSQVGVAAALADALRLIAQGQLAGRSNGAPR